MIAQSTVGEMVSASPCEHDPAPACPRVSVGAASTCGISSLHDAFFPSRFACGMRGKETDQTTDG